MYNYKRAFQKDSKIIVDYFSLIQNIKAKHSILNKNTYNLNKTGFIIDIIVALVVIILSKR